MYYETFNKLCSHPWQIILKMNILKIKRELNSMHKLCPHHWKSFISTLETNINNVYLLTKVSNEMKRNTPIL